VKKQECLEIKMKMEIHGYPIPPSPKDVVDHDLLCKKKLIGRFISNTYGS